MELKLFNKTYTPSQELMNYVELRHLYSETAQTCVEEFMEEFRDKCYSADSAAENGNRLANKYFQTIIEFTLNLLAKYKVYTVGADDVKGYARKFGLNEPWEESFSDFTDAYEEIVGEGQAEIEYRAERKANRGKFIGGGFGWSGAIEGAAEAGVLNAATGLAHSGVNLIGNAATRLGMARNKSKLYASALEDLFMSMYISLSAYYLAAMDLLEEYCDDDIEFESPVGENDKKASTMFENVKAGRIPEEELKDIMADIVMLYPIESGVYEWMIEKFGDENGEIETFANAFKIDVSECKEELIKKEFDPEMKEIREEHKDDPDKSGLEKAFLELKQDVLYKKKQLSLSKTTAFESGLDKELKQLADTADKALAKKLDEAKTIKDLEAFISYVSSCSWNEQAKEKYLKLAIEAKTEKEETVKKLEAMTEGYENKDKAELEKLLAELRKYPDDLNKTCVTKVSGRLDGIYKGEIAALVDQLDSRSEDELREIQKKLNPYRNDLKETAEKDVKEMLAKRRAERQARELEEIISTLPQLSIEELAEKKVFVTNQYDKSKTREKCLAEIDRILAEKHEANAKKLIEGYEGKPLEELYTVRDGLAIIPEKIAKPYSEKVKERIWAIEKENLEAILNATNGVKDLDSLCASKEKIQSSGYTKKLVSEYAEKAQEVIDRELQSEFDREFGDLNTADIDRCFAAEAWLNERETVFSDKLLRSERETLDERETVIVTEQQRKSFEWIYLPGVTNPVSEQETAEYQKLFQRNKLERFVFMDFKKGLLSGLEGFACSLTNLYVLRGGKNLERYSIHTVANAYAEAKTGLLNKMKAAGEIVVCINDGTMVVLPNKLDFNLANSYAAAIARCAAELTVNPVSIALREHTDLLKKKEKDLAPAPAPAKTSAPASASDTTSAMASAVASAMASAKTSAPTSAPASAMASAMASAKTSAPTSAPASAMASAMASAKIDLSDAKSYADAAEKLFADGSQPSPKLLAGLGIPLGERVYTSEDTTMLHSGKNGFAVTEKGFYCRDAFEQTVFTPFAALKGGKLSADDDNHYLRVNGRLIVYTFGSMLRTKQKVEQLLDAINKMEG